jgi:hypothetical protein
VKQKRKRRRQANMPTPSLPRTEWVAEDGFHFLVPGQPPSPEQLEEMTRAYREKIRSDPRWAELVRQLGAEKAEELLPSCRVELRSR